MLAKGDLQRMQCEQFRHDKRNHCDILCLPKPDRLKHYGLHYAKYVGCLARGTAERKAHDQTVVDAILIALSAANTLHQDLSTMDLKPKLCSSNEVDPLRVFAEAVGRFADACEKLDHLEDSYAMACDANIDVLSWLFVTAFERDLDINSAITARRKELANQRKPLLGNLWAMVSAEEWVFKR
jgi:hypothetical protein